MPKVTIHPMVNLTMYFLHCNHAATSVTRVTCAREEGWDLAVGDKGGTQGLGTRAGLGSRG